MISRRRSPFNDQRCYRKWEEIGDRMFKHKSVTISQLASSKREADSFYHFIGNKRIQMNELIHMGCQISGEVLQGRHILLLGDTSSYNLKNHINRIQDSHRIGVLEDNKTPGFFSHVHLVVDAALGTVLGLADIMLWCREKSMAKTAKNAEWEDRESYKWYQGASNAREATSAAGLRTYVFDRDADNYELCEKLHQLDPNDHFVIRLHHDRPVIFEGERLRMGECLAKQNPLGTYELDLPALNHYSSSSGKRIERQKRTAKMELRACHVQVNAPEKGKMPTRSMMLSLVEAREVSNDLPHGQEPVVWRLLTTHQVETFEQALQIIQFYMSRWMIEQLFRVMKTDGLDLESTEIERFDSIMRQTIMAYEAACKILQLVYARDRNDSQPIEEVFTPKEQEVLAKLNQKYQGNTPAQKNPYEANQTSWATWIIARIGGWKGYRSQRPPGPSTLALGLVRFAVFVEAHALFKEINDS
jgi:hypothetical protein